MLKTLEDHNEEIIRLLRENSGTAVHKNGIACPSCGCELLDSQPGVQLLTWPGQLRTKCSSPICTYTGYRNTL
jgi:hypothetical protein